MALFFLLPEEGTLESGGGANCTPSLQQCEEVEAAMFVTYRT